MSSWYKKNKKKALAYQKEYNLANRDRYIEYHKKYYIEKLKSKREAEKIPRPPKSPKPEKVPKPPKSPKPEKVYIKKPKTYIPYEPKIMITTGNYILTFD
jgi:hypothetical protein